MSTTPPKGPSLYQYLRDSIAAGVIDFSLRAQRQPDGGIHFYIHPAGVSGATEDFLIWDDPENADADLIGNRRNIPEPDVEAFRKFLAAHVHEDPKPDPFYESRNRA